MVVDQLPILSGLPVIMNLTLVKKLGKIARLNALDPESLQVGRRPLWYAFQTVFLDMGLRKIFWTYLINKGLS